MTQYICRKCGISFVDIDDFYPSVLCKDCSRRFVRKMRVCDSDNERLLLIKEYRLSW